MSPFKPASMGAEEAARLYDAMQSTLREAISRSEGLAASELKREKKSDCGCTAEPVNHARYAVTPYAR
jgi:formamidopyrimidine-DNA glycosylase